MGHERFDHEEEVHGSSNRTFGIAFACFFGILGLLPLVFEKGIKLWAFGVAAVFLAAALLFSTILSPLNRFWLKLGLLLHKIVSPILLGIMFFGVFTPMGLFGRLLGKDPLRLCLDQDAASYWIERKPPGPAPETFKDQF